MLIACHVFGTALGTGASLPSWNLYSSGGCTVSKQAHYLCQMILDFMKKSKTEEDNKERDREMLLPVWWLEFSLIRQCVGRDLNEERSEPCHVLGESIPGTGT